MKRAMLFIDFDNLAIGMRSRAQWLDFDVLCDTIREKVKADYKDDCLIFGKCYRNYDRSKNPDGAAFEAHIRGIVPVFVPHYSAGLDRSKSLCDPMLICDAMEALYTNREIDIFVLVSSDKDFLPLLRKIAEGGKAVIVIGIERDASVLIGECTRMNFPFVDYTQLTQQAETRAKVVS